MKIGVNCIGHKSRKGCEKNEFERVRSRTLRGHLTLVKPGVRKTLMGGDDAALGVIAHAIQTEAAEAVEVPLGGIAEFVLEALVALKIFFRFGQSVEGELVAGAFGVEVEGEGAQPARRRGRHRLPQLVAVEFDLGQHVAVPLVDLVRVGCRFARRAQRIDPSLDVGEHARVVGRFTQLDFPSCGLGSGDAGERASGGENGGQE